MSSADDLVGLRERTLVSIISYYRGFEPISRAIVKECTKTEPHTFRTQIDSREEAVARTASIDERRNMEIRPAESAVSSRGTRICIDSGPGHLAVELTDLNPKITAIERQLTKQCNQQRHMMRQMSDLSASVSDLRACVQQQVSEKESVLILYVFVSVSTTSCVMHVLMLVSVHQASAQMKLKVAIGQASSSRLSDHCLSDLVVYARACLCTDRRFTNVSFAFPCAILCVMSRLVNQTEKFLIRLHRGLPKKSVTTWRENLVKR